MPDLSQGTTEQIKALRIKEITVAQAPKILFSHAKTLIKISIKVYVMSYY